MERVLRLTPATISNSWYEDGVIADPGVVTVDIARADGTALVTDGATSGTGAAARTYNLTAATHTNLLDTLTVTWESTTKGTVTAYVEVVGGFLFSVADARAVSPLQNTTTYPTAKIVAVRTLVEEAIEDACGVAFVPRYTRETLSGVGEADLPLNRARLRSIRSVSIDGETLASADLAEVGIHSARYINYPNHWDQGYSNVIVGYEHGFDFPPARISRAAILLAKRWLVEGPIDDRATSLITEDGTFALTTPGLRGALFDLPEVNAAIEEYNYAGYQVW
jgi:hypothetical protein